ADLVDLAVHGHLIIEQSDKKDWSVTRREASGAAPIDSQRVLLEKLFAKSPHLELKNTNASEIGGARMHHLKAMDKRMHPAYFKRNGWPLLLGWLFSVAYGGLAFMVAGGAGVLLIIGVLVLTLVAHLAFGWLMKA